MLNRILPLLNRILPNNVASKGLSKINPRFGKFITNAAMAGYGIEETLDFLRDQFESNEEKGLRPDEAAAQKRIKQSGLPQDIVKAGAKTALGTAGISAIPTVIGNMFGAQEEEQNITSKEEALKRFKEHQAKKSMMDQESERFQGYYQPQQQQQMQQGQPGQGQQSNTDAALMAAIQKVLNM